MHALGLSQSGSDRVRVLRRAGAGPTLAVLVPGVAYGSAARPDTARIGSDIAAANTAASRSSAGAAAARGARRTGRRAEGRSFVAVSSDLGVRLPDRADRAAVLPVGVRHRGLQLDPVGFGQEDQP